jgi:hypothetical protein
MIDIDLIKTGDVIEKYFQRKRPNVIDVRCNLASDRTNLGISLLVVDAILHCNRTFAYFSPTSKQSKSVVSLVSEKIEKICNTLNVDSIILRCSSDTISLANGSKIIFRRFNERCIKGMAINGMFLDMNIEKIDDLDQKFLDCVIPVLACTNAAMLVSLTD